MYFTATALYIITLSATQSHTYNQWKNYTLQELTTAKERPTAHNSIV